MNTILLYGGMLAARELTSMLNGERLGVTLCELHEGKPEFICSEGAPDPLILKMFEENINGAERACLVHHGMVTFKDGHKCAAIIIRASTHESEEDIVIFGLPYRAPGHPNGFAVHAPMVMSSVRHDEIIEEWMDSLFEGFATENPDLWGDYGEEL